MKKLKNLIKLTNLNSEYLQEKELILVTGGDVIGDCSCGCFYAGCGGSSRLSNRNANYDPKDPKVSPLPPADHDCGII